MIYKPSDLSPIAQSFDVFVGRGDNPNDVIFFECKLDTSNVVARGYTIKVYNSENELVFSSIPIDADGREEPLDIKYITLIEDLNQYMQAEFSSYTTGYGGLLNSGYNGTYLKIPFVVQAASKDDGSYGTVWKSQVFYDAIQSPAYQSQIYRYENNNGSVGSITGVDLYNGQEYKWAITLYQLEDVGDSSTESSWDLPNNPLYYDMPLTTGTILGSNSTRIQTVPSNEIMADYFVQPVKITGLKYDPNMPDKWSCSSNDPLNEGISDRALIKAYDPTYGYIYPVGGSEGLLENLFINQVCNGFRMYQRGNNTSNLNAYQQVFCVCDSSLDNDSSNYGSWSWSSNDVTPGNSYWIQIYNVAEKPTGNSYSPPLGLGDLKLSGGERIIFNHMKKNAVITNEYLGSAFNGIYYSQGYEVGDKTGDHYPVTIKWYRVPDADTWGELMNKVVTVTGTASLNYYLKNLQIQELYNNNDVYGNINQTPFKFVPEKPIEIYKNYYNQYVWGQTYNEGDIVSYTPPGTYGQYNSSSSYNAGTIVYDSSNNPNYYISILAVSPGVPLTNEDYWAPYTAQSYYVAKVDISSTDYPVNLNGTINSAWSENPYIGNTGVIFYNNPLGKPDPISSTDDTTGRLYIRHFDGLKNGMVLFKNTTNNIQNYIRINNYNPDYNFVEYNRLYEFDNYRAYNSSSNPSSSSSEDTEWIPSNSNGDGTKYQIKTFFRESDENAFNLYTTPQITINPSFDDFGNLTVNAIYSQDQFVGWRNAQWFLYNAGNILLNESSILYDGNLSYIFKGLDSGSYIIKLILENYAGARIEVETTSSFDDESDYDSSDMSIFFDCSTESVGLHITKPITNLSIYRRDVWYNFTGDYNYNNQLKKNVPVIEPRVQNKWELVLDGQDAENKNTVYLSGNNIYDFNVGNKRFYEYKCIYRDYDSSNENTPIQKFMNSVKTQMDGWTLSELVETVDITGKKQYTVSLDNVWKFKYNISPGDTTQNLSQNQQETLGVFPKFINGPKNHLSGNVTCLLGKEVKPFNWLNVDFDYKYNSQNQTFSWEPYNATRGYNNGGYIEELSPDYYYSRETFNKSMDMLEQWRGFCFSGNPKLLRDYKGRCLIVKLHDPSYNIEEEWSTRPISLSFSWTEIAPTTGVLITTIDDGANLRYELINDGSAYKVTGYYVLENKDLIIPGSYRGLPVIEIDSDAFYDADLTSVVVPDSVTSIGNGAFINNNNLNSATGPIELFNANIITMDNLVRVNITSGTTITPEQFGGLRRLSVVTIGNSVTSIGNYAFSICSSLTSVTIGNSITSIGVGVFSYCSSLTSITIPNSVTSIGVSAFSGCSGLTSITIPNGVTSIGGYAFYRCNSLTSITIPNSVTSIGESAFNGCSSLTSITIPFVGNRAGVTSSDTYQYPFGYIFGTTSYTGAIATEQKYYGSSTSSTTTSIYYIPNSLKSVTVTGGNILYGAFYNCSGLTSVTIGNGVMSIGDWAFYNCSGLTSATIGNGVTSIGESTFSYCTSLTSVTIPNSVTNIEDAAFSWCTSLTSVTIPNSITSIGSAVFLGCHSLTNITIPDSVTNIGNAMFRECSGLTSVTIPNSVTNIGSAAFYRCYSLKTIFINATIPPTLGTTVFYDTNDAPIFVPAGYEATYRSNSDWSNYADRIVTIGLAYATMTGGVSVSYGNATETAVVIPKYNPEGESVVAIAEYAFENKSSLTSVTIPNSVTSIGRSAFSGCIGLTSATIPNSVTSISGSAFSGCSGLTSITVEGGNAKYHSSGNCLIETESKTLIFGCKNSVIPSDGSVTSIGYEAFYGCSSLTSITIPDSVTSIGIYAFYECIGLTSATIPNSVTSLGYGTFYNCSGLTSVTIGNSVTSTGDYAFHNCSSLTSVTIGNSVTSIGQSAFSGCSSLTSVTIPDSIVSIGNYAFYGCSGLTSAIFKNTVGWFVTQSSSATSGTPVSVTNATTNATKLTSTYVYYYWKRS